MNNAKDERNMQIRFGCPRKRRRSRKYIDMENRGVSIVGWNFLGLVMAYA